MSVSTGVVDKTSAQKKITKEVHEEKKLAEMMIPKKKKELYKKIMYGKKRKEKEVRNKFLRV